MQAEILSILGPSGSGKTMTLKCIAGLIKPDEGRIELNGKVLFDSDSGINLPSQQRKVGFVFQNYALFPHLTVHQNTAFAMNKRTKKEKEDRADWLLEKMHVKGLENRYPRQISSGQQQRVALARALSHEPEILLLDEPFSALDTPRKERLEYELMELQRFYKGDILFVTHDLSQGYKLSSRLAVYESGRIIQCDNKQDVISCPVNRTVARLTGLKNLMDGNIISIDGSELLVEVPNLGTRLKVKTEKSSNLTVSQHITLGIRPEHIFISEKPVENSVSGKITQVMEGVTSINFFFRVDRKTTSDYDLEATLPKALADGIDPDKACCLRLPQDHLIIIAD